MRLFASQPIIERDRGAAMHQGQDRFRDCKFEPWETGNKGYGWD